MQLDLNRYRVNKQFMLFVLSDKLSDSVTMQTIQHSIALTSASVHCPVIALFCYLLEEYKNLNISEHIAELLVERIAHLIDFYGYTAIIGFEGDLPTELSKFYAKE